MLRLNTLNGFGAIQGANKANYWDITAYEATGVTYAITAPIGFTFGTPRGLFIDSNGENFFTTDAGEEYSFIMSEWSLGTAQNAYLDIDRFPIRTAPIFTSDGLTCIALGESSSMRFYQIELDASFNMRSESSYKYVGLKDDAADIIFSAGYNGQTQIGNNSDLSKIYVPSLTGLVLQFDLPSPGDVGTASSYLTAVDSIDLSSIIGAVASRVYVSPDDTRLFIAVDASDTVYQFSLSGNISTATLVGSQSFSSVISGGINGIYFKPTGSRMYLLDTTDDTIHEFAA